MKKLAMITLAATVALGGCAGYGYDNGYYNGYDNYGYQEPYYGTTGSGYYTPAPGYRVLGYNDRIYRGPNGEYYCRRADGSAGTIVGGLAGAVAGGILGNLIAPGGSKDVGTVLGAIGGGAAGAAVGNSADRRNQLYCR